MPRLIGIQELTAAALLDVELDSRLDSLKRPRLTQKHPRVVVNC